MSAAVRAARGPARVAVPTDRFHIGDCLPVLAELVAKHGPFADLVYLDPPFNSKRLYNHAFQGMTRTLPQKVAFHDSWEWDDDAKRGFREFTDNEAPRTAAARFLTAMREHLQAGDAKDKEALAYLVYMVRRLARIRAAMKPAASVYLHCDPTASHYLKLAMDALFGRENFRNEVVWSYRRWSGKTKAFQKMHDNILFYTRSKGAHIWQWPMEPKASGTPSFKRWNEWDAKKGRLVTKSDKSVAVSETNMRDVWEIPRLQSSSKERLGYMTQKPLALLKRIIAASSNEGDLVLDPFCGCGTTIAACHEQGRRFIGVDVARSAAQVIAERMQTHYPDFGKLRVGEKPAPANVRGWGKLLPDEDTLDGVPAWARFQYEAIAAIPKAEQIEGAIQRTARQGADGGIDGRLHIRLPDTGALNPIVIQVKRKKRPSVADVADTLAAVDNNGAFMGLLITLHPPTAEMRKRAEAKSAGKLGGKHYPKVAILTYEQVKAGEYAQAIPHHLAVDVQVGGQRRLGLTNS